MNSFLQQLFYVPEFRQGVLTTATYGLKTQSLNSNINNPNESSSTNNNNNPENDNVSEKSSPRLLPQLKRLFAFLTMSYKRNYNMHPFVSTIKNENGGE